MKFKDFLNSSTKSESLKEVMRDIKKHFKRKDAWPLNYVHYYLVSNVREKDFISVLIRNNLKVVLDKKRCSVMIVRNRRKSK